MKKLINAVVLAWLCFTVVFSSAQILFSQQGVNEVEASVEK